MFMDIRLPNAEWAMSCLPRRDVWTTLIDLYMSNCYIRPAVHTRTKLYLTCTWGLLRKPRVSRFSGMTAHSENLKKMFSYDHPMFLIFALKSSFSSVISLENSSGRKAIHTYSVRVQRTRFYVLFFGDCNDATWSTSHSEKLKRIVSPR